MTPPNTENTGNELDEIENILATFLAKQRNLEWRINQNHRKDEATRVKLISESSEQNLESAKSKLTKYTEQQVLIGRIDELVPIQVNYGHYVAQTYIDGKPISLFDRLTQLKAQLKGKE